MSLGSSIAAIKIGNIVHLSKGRFAIFNAGLAKGQSTSVGTDLDRAPLAIVTRNRPSPLAGLVKNGPRLHIKAHAAFDRRFPTLDFLLGFHHGQMKPIQKHKGCDENDPMNLATHGPRNVAENLIGVKSEIAVIDPHRNQRLN